MTITVVGFDFDVVLAQLTCYGKTYVEQDLIFVLTQKDTVDHGEAGFASVIVAGEDGRRTAGVECARRASDRAR